MGRKHVRLELGQKELHKDFEDHITRPANRSNDNGSNGGRPDHHRQAGVWSPGSFWDSLLNTPEHVLEAQQDAPGISGGQRAPN